MSPSASSSGVRVALTVLSTTPTGTRRTLVAERASRASFHCHHRSAFGFSRRDEQKRATVSPEPSKLATMPFQSARLLRSPICVEALQASRRGERGRGLGIPYGYVFPAQLGLFGEGMPTSVGASVPAERLRLGENDQVVWPVAHGSPDVAQARGRLLTPLYRSVPLAAADDPVLHEYLALVDALRIGRARERAIAKDEFVKRLASLERLGPARRDAVVAEARARRR